MADDRRERVKLTFSPAEMRALRPVLKRLHRFAPTATAIKNTILQVVEHIDDFEGLVTRGDHGCPAVPTGAQRSPETAYHDPAPARGSSSQKEERRSEEKKKKATRLAPLDVSERVLGHLNQAAGSSFRPSAEGHRRKLAHALTLGTEAEIIAMIDRKVDQWGGCEIAHCLRPSTLFGPRCEEYLGEAPGGARPRQTSLLGSNTFAPEDFAVGADPCPESDKPAHLLFGPDEDERRRP